MGDAAPPQPPASAFVPRLHGAIVERLRARIALCRRHHSSCESRYQRGQAENSDREHESTLHLLSIVQQGSGSRKVKGSRASAQQQAESSGRLNGEQKPQSGAGAEPRSSTRIALHGTLRRKIEGHPPEYNPKLNRLSGEVLSSVYKRLCVEGNALGDPGYVFGDEPATSGNHLMGHSMSRKDSDRTSQGIGECRDLFSLTLKEMKKEPEEVHSCGSAVGGGGGVVFGFKEECGGQIDPDLQELFDELTKSVPPLSDPDFEKILKQDDSFSLDLDGAGSLAVGEPCPPMQKVIKVEYSPGYVQDPGGSPGPDFPMAASSSTSRGAPITAGSSQDSQGSSGASRGLAAWLQVSHAEQLKQMAANQVPAMLHVRQQGALCWPPELSTTLGLAAGCQSGSRTQGPPLAPLNESLVELSRHGGPSFKDCNRSDSVSLRGSMMAAPQRKQQHSIAAQSQNPPGHFRNQHLPIPVSPGLAQKRLTGLHLQPDQQRQEKMNVPDHLACHLSNPPPDYKQPRANLAEVVQTNHYSGDISASSPQTPLSTVSTLSGFYGNHLLVCQDAKVTASSSSKRYTSGPEYHQGAYGRPTNMNRLEQQGDPLRPVTREGPMGHRGDTMVTNSMAASTAGWDLPPVPRAFPDMRHGNFESHPFSHIAMAMLPVNGLPVGAAREPVPRVSQVHSLTTGGRFSGPGNTHGRHSGSQSLNFLPDGDGVGPGGSAESDFIDSLLKSGSGNDDWMKDINLDEILGGHT
ncbi:uncharacterized protein maml2 [Paramormyrops kingsleyae]|uniref:Neurogenic mastermind-like N-terminal domain-containing protein n=1 Tax=Paramormyrops kingsleyae TaxID=1676925 RepID=A0A3B3SXZ5_9TELE|nr:mastermind-like protein 2 [Paramormyrops kingsleyae]